VVYGFGFVWSGDYRRAGVAEVRALKTVMFVNGIELKNDQRRRGRNETLNTVGSRSRVLGGS
jgi:hypothetical protein